MTMDSTANLLVVMATYNELENLPDLVRQVRLLLPHADLLIVDDNSPDGTGRWVAAQAVADERIRCLHRPRKLGLGSATVDALRYALEHDYTFMVALDADGSHNPQDIPRMLARAAGDPAGGPDVVIGSRYVPGGGTRGWPVHRRMMSRAVNTFARVMLGLPVHDCSGAFRCIRVDLLRRVDLASIRSHGYSFFEEILWRFKQAGARIEEIPIVFANRAHGTSKINLRESLASITMLVRLGLRNWLTVTRA
jgi:dolichol-phosphate mannosyltransferase